MIVQNNMSDVLNSDISCEARVGVILEKAIQPKTIGYLNVLSLFTNLKYRHSTKSKS